MSEARENFATAVKSALLNAHYSFDDITKISNIVVAKLADYELNPKSTEIAIIDTESEQLIKVYGNTLLTEGKSVKTVQGYVRLLKRFLREIGTPLTNVGVFDVRIWLANEQQKNSRRTCENYRAYLSAFYQWLLKEDLISKNPMAKINPIKYEEEVRTAFSEAEIDALRSSCKTLRERAEFEVLISSGARVSELCALNKSDVDLNSLKVIIREGKGGKQRTTYINDVCRVHLQRYLDSRTDDMECLFVTRNKSRLTKGAAESDLHRIGADAGVSNVHPHRCRRTFATALSKKGMDICTIQRLMGHSNVNTTMGYISTNEEFIHNEYRRCS